MIPGLVFLALLGAAPQSGVRTHLIAVGNNQGRADEPELRFAERDAERVADVLRELGRVEPSDELVLRGTSADGFRTALLRTNAELRRIEGPTALVVYYSGHADAEGLHLGASTMRFDELETIVESSPAQVRVLILDACRSGGITRVKGVSPAEPFEIQLQDRLDVEGFAIITSSAESEDSQESDGLRASFFTHHLVSGLRGAADADGDLRVSLQEAYAYAYRETLRSSGKTLMLQHPTYAYAIEGKGDFVLTHLSDGKGRFGALRVEEPGIYLVHDDGERNLVTAELRVREGGARVLLAPGRYFVQRRARQSYREYEVDIARDRTTELAKVGYRDVRYARLLRKGGGEAASVHSVRVGVEARGALLQDYPAVPSGVLAYGLDLAEISLGLGLRVGRSGAGAAPTRDYTELGLRVRADRYFDFVELSLSVGAFIEAMWVQQRFDTRGEAPDRQAGVVGGGLAVGVERSLGPWLLRLEGGPASFVLEGAETEGGAVVGSSPRTPLTAWGSFSVGFRL